MGPGRAGKPRLVGLDRSGHRMFSCVEGVNYGIEVGQKLRVGIEALLHWLGRMSVLGLPACLLGSGAQLL